MFGFKSVEYLGFDGQPDLKAKAEQLTPVLVDEVRRWRELVEVVWSPSPDAGGGLNLALSLTLPPGVSGTSLGTIRQKDFHGPRPLRSHCRGVWSDLLGNLSHQLMGRIEASLAEAVEV